MIKCSLDRKAKFTRDEWTHQRCVQLTQMSHTVDLTCRSQSHLAIYKIKESE